MRNRGNENIVTCEITEVQLATLGKVSDGDMRHCHFLKSTLDIGDPLQSLGYLEVSVSHEY